MVLRAVLCGQEAGDEVAGDIIPPGGEGEAQAARSARFRGEEVAIPTRAPIAKVVGDFVRNMLGKKRKRNAGKDIYCLREAFGPICPEREVKNRR